jgi:hypothetical protein
VSGLFDNTPLSTLGKDPDRRGTARDGALGERRYLVPSYAPPRSTCGKCGAAITGIDLDGALVWLDVASEKPAGRNARTARLHSEVCP